MPKAFVQRLQDFARISLPSDKIPTGKVSLPSQMREQMSGPDLHVFTLKFLAPPKNCFFLIKNTLQIFLTYVYFYSMQLFSADPFQKNFKLIFCP